MASRESVLVSILKHLTDGELLYYQSKMPKYELEEQIKSMRKVVEEYKDFDPEIDDECRFAIFIILERIKNAILLETKVQKIVEEECHKFVYALNKTLSEVKTMLDESAEAEDESMYDIKNGVMGATTKTKQKRTNYPKQISKLLKSWLRDNINNPYPTEKEKQFLCDRTGLDHTQINNWFINARRRILPSLRQKHHSVG
ncbi:hypothetical protein VCUG_01289 [Vavraia culicis subsp. floridensis]|uniref:Homeobox domain-containing protein n=1 Tax=Vavraia culicis (isolate floridensis) TaxID=948595 RepID=L2GU77_VAVCU|nr:uncharacterized protein VCUG_01289 [Vavraia culicis subsp. floridensis]ELA47189.1 hypothetical protein VCUG_01289 [Vavraia culicis subsp. floridensis]